MANYVAISKGNVILNKPTTQKLDLKMTLIGSLALASVLLSQLNVYLIPVPKSAVAGLVIPLIGFFGIVALVLAISSCRQKGVRLSCGGCAISAVVATLSIGVWLMAFTFSSVTKAIPFFDWFFEVQTTYWMPIIIWTLVTGVVCVYFFCGRNDQGVEPINLSQPPGGGGIATG